MPERILRGLNGYQSITEPSSGSNRVRYCCGSPTCAISLFSSMVMPRPGSVGNSRWPFLTGGNGFASVRCPNFRAMSDSGEIPVKVEIFGQCLHHDVLLGRPLSLLEMKMQGIPGYNAVQPSMNVLVIGHAVTGMLLMAAVCLSQTVSTVPRVPGDLASNRAVLETALADEGLSKELEIIRLRRGDHPDSSTDRQVYRLELRFRADGSQDAADAQFQSYLDAHKGLPEHLFYRVAHVLDLDRQFISVHFHVIESEYMVFFDSSSRDLVLQREANRSVRKSISVRAPTFSPSGRGRAGFTPRHPK